MAGKGGGGAWKVAYADFVTAMMAFFLVMWIVGQDQQVRRSVSDYFSDPLGTATSTTAQKPSRTGSVADYNINTGRVPLEESVATGTGRKSFTLNRESSSSTKLINDWLRQNEEANKYWLKQAKDQREAARWSSEVRVDRRSVEFVATRQLILQMHEEFDRDVVKKTNGLYQDLLRRTLLDVNWAELAEDLIGR